MKDWRDKNMTVTMSATLIISDGHYKRRRFVTAEFPAKMVHYNALNVMRRHQKSRPEWRDDPTYDLKRTKTLPSAL